jgi:glycine/D-amino acid oxidase-like deaminating enzyme
MSIVSVVRVGTKDAPTAIVDMAGKAGGGSSRRAPQYRRPNFARALSSRLGQPSRFMWRDIENDLELIQRELEPIVDRVEAALNRDLKTSF